MQSHTRNPAEIFGTQIRYVVPLFQRPYVWTEKDQWEPLWADVRTLADRLLEVAPQPMVSSSIPPHFLGAIVVEQQAGIVGFIDVWHVVDGQQRLTTLQLLLDAAQEVVENHGLPMDAQGLRVLVLNEPQIIQHAHEVFKVWPTDRDQAAFRAAMDNDTVVSPELRDSRIAQAHAFFLGVITEWADVTGDAEKVHRRLNALVRALREHLKVVVIGLEPGDNAQVIFETLNHRGAPLLAADLVKNLIFQIAQVQRLDVADLYTTYWQPLDGDYWRGLVSQGRLYRPRIDLFLNYWLTMKLQREVPTDRVYADFRDYVARPDVDLPALIAEIAADATVFAQLETLPQSTVAGTFYYRVVQAMDTGTVTPVLLWLMRFSEAELPTDQRDRALHAIESWLVRRMLARLTAKGLNLVLLELLKTLSESGPATAGEAVERFLARQTADARLWPDDDMVRSTLASEPVYRSLVRPRVRMILETLEDELRTEYGEGESCPRGLSIEHIMPRGWREHWPLDQNDDARAVRRDRAVHRLGNLTLVSGKLNPAMSNRPWTKADGQDKRNYLLTHSNLTMNAQIVKEHPTSWIDEDIVGRTAALSDKLLELWPRPATAVATTVDMGAREPETLLDAAAAANLSAENGVDSDVGKYRNLWRWLQDQDAVEAMLSFTDVEEILGFALPSSAREHPPHWYGYGGTALGRAIRDAGWKASQVNLADEQVTFVRPPEG